MKSKKFKLETKVMYEVIKTIKASSYRTRELLKFSLENNDWHNTSLLIMYEYTLLNYLKELESLEKNSSSYVLISEELMSRLNNSKNFISSLESEIDKTNIYSLRIH